MYIINYINVNALYMMAVAQPAFSGDHKHMN